MDYMDMCPKNNKTYLSVNLYIYLLVCMGVCLFFPLNLINVKTAEPIRPNFVRDLSWPEGRYMNAKNYKKLSPHIFVLKILKINKIKILNTRKFFIFVSSKKKFWKIEQLIKYLKKIIKINKKRIRINKTINWRKHELHDEYMCSLNFKIYQYNPKTEVNLILDWIHKFFPFF